MLDVSADQALAFRVAGHHLDRRVGAEEAVAAIGLQEYPPGWGALAALRARSLDPLPPDVGAGQRVPRLAVRGPARGRADLHGGAGARGRGRAEVAGRGGAGEGGHRGGVRGRGGARARRRGGSRGARGRAAGPRRVPPGDAGAAAGRPAAVVPRLPEPPRAAGVLARARPAGGHRDAGEGDVGARRAALDAARGRPRGAGAAVPARLRAGDAHAARVVGADRAVAREAALRRESKDELAPASVEGRKGFVLAADVDRLSSPPAGVGRAPARRPRPLRGAARPRDRSCRTTR